MMKRVSGHYGRPRGHRLGRASVRHDTSWLPVSRVRGADTSLVVGALPVFLETLASHCRGLPGDELATLDRVLERQLYEIDRADIHAVTGGSDDGFLYSHGFVVALGQDFYHGVIHDPQMAVPYAECEEICYFFAHLYRERFGDFPDTGSGIARESCSNSAGWAPRRPET